MMSNIIKGLNEACWKGYHKEGMKTMFGKKYPNCVKNKKKANEGIGEPEYDENEIRKYYKDRNQPVPTDEKGQAIVPASWKAKKAVQPTEPDSWSTSKGVVTKTPTGIIHKSRQLTPKPTLVKDLEEAFPRPYGSLNPYGTIKEPKAKIRTYTYERPDGSIATRYEVLDKYGHRVKGQGTEGFDDIENAKALLRSLYEQTATQSKPTTTTQKINVDQVKLAIQKLPKPEQDKMVIFVKKLLDKQYNITREGQIYSTGGGAGEGQHWYKPRTVPNQHELENNNKNFNVQKNTARQFAKEINDLVKEFGQLAQARPSSPKLDDLRKNILELHTELQNLGYDYDPKSPTLIRPLTLDVSKMSKIKEDESSILNQKMKYQEYLDKAEELHFAFLAASKANDKKEMERLKLARDNLDAIASKGLVLENLGTPYPGTYEQETLPYRTKGQKRTPAIAFESDYEQGVAEATGDAKFDTMMGKITKPSAVKALGREEKVHELIRQYFWHKRRADQGPAVTAEYGHDRMAQKVLMALKKMNVDLSKMDPAKLKAIKGEVYEQGVAEDDNFKTPGTMMRGSPQAVSQAQNIIQQQADKNIIGQAKIAGTMPNQGLEEDQLDEKWSDKYKRSINCNNPKGFSQKAHCQGRNKK